MNKIEGTERFFDLLEKSIIGVETIEGIFLEKDFLKLCWFKNKYSNLDHPSLSIIYNNSPLNRNNHKVTYECLCGQINKIHIKKFLSKKTLVCSKCRETEEKRKKHSELLRSKDFKKKDNTIKKMSNEEEINSGETQFNLENYEFKEKYYHRNLTLGEFNQIKANHIWHRKQLECGVWKSKILSAIEYTKENNLTYKILFQEDIEEFFNLLRYSLDYDENYRS